MNCSSVYGIDLLLPCSQLNLKAIVAIIFYFPPFVWLYAYIVAFLHYSYELGGVYIVNALLFSCVNIAHAQIQKAPSY